MKAIFINNRKSTGLNPPVGTIGKVKDVYISSLTKKGVYVIKWPKGAIVIDDTWIYDRDDIELIGKNTSLESVQQIFNFLREVLGVKDFERFVANFWTNFNAKSD